jgi:peroxiredoxin
MTLSRSVAIVAALAVVAGIFFRHYFVGRSPSVIGRDRIDFTMADIDGKPRHLSEWDGKVLLVNFWATWCPPCREEIPGFIKLQSQYGAKGLQIIGVAVDDRDAVRKFVHEHGMNYPVLVGDEDGTLSREYGNDIGALPYTILIDRHGRIIATHRGLFALNEAETAIRPLL